MEADVAVDFLVALAIGALVGIEREKKKADDPAPSFGGIRTHMLVALLGALSAWLSRESPVPWIFLVTLAVVGTAIVASYVHQNRRSDDVGGLTSEMAAVAVFLLGAMVIAGQAMLAAALGVTVSALLVYKRPLHQLVGRLDADDLYAAIKLLAASVIVLPLLPDAPIDPWGAINPYRLWLLVILISALSLVGYAAVRLLGSAHGTAVTGIAGGLVSSTAATLGFARTSRVEPDASRAHSLAAGVLLAWLVMFVRIAVLLAVVNPRLLANVWMPYAAMAAVTLGFAGWHYRRGLRDAARRHDATSGGDGRDLRVRNPFSLTSAIRFGALFAAVLLLVAIAREQAPGVGVLVVAALTGTVDVDAITLSVASQAGEGDELGRASLAVVIATLSNTITKCGLVVVLGRGPARRQVATATAAIVGAGAAVVLAA